MHTPRQQLIQDLLASMNTVRRGMYTHLQAANHLLPIPRAQLELLIIIKYSQPVSFKELAKQLYVTPGAISQLAEGLEQAKLIQRRVDPSDRRIQCLEVTKKGDALLHTIEKRRQRIMESVMQDLSNEELELWVRIHKKILQQFKAELDNETDKENA
jgi:DNA-binding MarR family transcriptional regulator